MDEHRARTGQERSVIVRLRLASNQQGDESQPKADEAVVPDARPAFASLDDVGNTALRPSYFRSCLASSATRPEILI